MRNTVFRVVEIFDSLEGEGKRAGAPATFIRLAGCNLRCAYCDTGQALEFDAGTEMTGEEILARVNKTYKRVTLTGGEPLLATGVDKLVRVLLVRGCEVNIETNGSVDITNFRQRVFIEAGECLWDTGETGDAGNTGDAAAIRDLCDMGDAGVPGGLFFTIDYKLPSSGVCGAMLERNYFALGCDDVLKFVVGAMEDVPIMAALAERMQKAADAGNIMMPQLFIGAVASVGSGNEGFNLPALAEIILNEPLLKDARMQLQFHKIIWGPDTQGV